jgi:hypothetical protein
LGFFSDPQDKFIQAQTLLKICPKMFSDRSLTISRGLVELVQDNKPKSLGLSLGLCSGSPQKTFKICFLAHLVSRGDHMASIVVVR